MNNTNNTKVQEYWISPTAVTLQNISSFSKQSEMNYKADSDSEVILKLLSNK